MGLEKLYENEVTCPYCGYSISDSWDLDGDDGEDDVMECGNCWKKFVWWRNIRISYSSKADCELNNEPHEFDVHEIDDKEHKVCIKCGNIKDL